jgi:hypothetical protein
MTMSYTKFPHVWIDALADAKHAATYRLALFLLYRNWRFPKDETVSVTNLATKNVQLTNQQKRDAIDELVSRGLIETFGSDGNIAAVKLLQI